MVILVKVFIHPEERNKRCRNLMTNIYMRRNDKKDFTYAATRLVVGLKLHQAGTSVRLTGAKDGPLYL